MQLQTDQGPTTLQSVTASWDEGGVLQIGSTVARATFLPAAIACAAARATPPTAAPAPSELFRPPCAAGTHFLCCPRVCSGSCHSVMHAPWCFIPLPNLWGMGMSVPETHTHVRRRIGGLYTHSQVQSLPCMAAKPVGQRMSESVRGKADAHQSTSARLMSLLAPEPDMQSPADRARVHQDLPTPPLSA